MKCFNCGQDIPEDSNVCEYCGKAVNNGALDFQQSDLSGESSKEGNTESSDTFVQAEQIVQPEQTVQAEAAENAEEEAPVQAEAAENAEEQAYVKVLEQAEPVPDFTGGAYMPDKKSGSPLAGALFIGAAVVVIAALAVFLGFKFAGFIFATNNKQLAYIKDDTLYYTSDMTKDKDAYPVCEIKGLDKDIYYLSNYIEFSGDGKYLYFFSKFNDTRNTLSRIKVSKIGKNIDKNESKIEDIETKAICFYSLNKGNKVVYSKNNNDVVIYDGREAKEIDSDIEYFYITYDDNYIIYEKNKDSDDSEKTDLYSYDIKKNKSEEIGKNVSSIYTSLSDKNFDKNFIVYDDADGELHLTTVDGNDEKIDSDTTGDVYVDYINKNVYYLKDNESTSKLYDFVYDKYAAEDENIKKPENKDYLNEVSESTALSSVYTEFRENVSENPDFRQQFYDGLSTDYLFSLNYFYNTDDKKRYYYDSSVSKWYEYDEVSYDEDYNKYYGVSDRIELREKLKNTDYEFNTSSLYCYDGKESKKVSENIYTYSAKFEGNVAIYSKLEIGSDKISIDKIDYTYEVESFIEDNVINRSDMDKLYCCVGGNESELDFDGSVSKIYVSQDGKTLVLFEYDSDNAGYIIYSASVEDNQLGEINRIEDDVTDGIFKDNVFYFSKDVDYYGDGDLYKLENGKAQKVLDEICCDYIDMEDFLYVENGIYLAYTDLDKNDFSGRLNLYNSKGKAVEIDKNVSSGALYISNNCILYVKNEDELYVYTGKGKTRRISRDIEAFVICADNEEVGI